MISSRRKLLSAVLIFSLYFTSAPQALAAWSAFDFSQSSQPTPTPSTSTTDQQSISLCPKDGKLQVLCTTTSADTLFKTILTYLLIAGALVAIIFLIWGGIKWITSGGDKTKVESARYTIIGAIIGLIVVFGSFLILNLVLGTLFGFKFDQNGLRIPSLLENNTGGHNTDTTGEVNTGSQ
ncbi:MAG: hypothetical protein KatS3mg089_0872 [Patescibacteria group bacterium]|nr:MAG: hypothetical protein KatS3mg089_0872 [Patescibacteria group bacterium]